MIIEIQDLQKTYRDGWFRRRRVDALQGVSFSVESGEIFGLLGPNGAGKTTLIKILLGIVRKSGGEAFLLGKPAGRRAVRRSIGYLPESHQIPRHLTGNTALEYYGCLSGLTAAEVRRRRPELLAMVGLAQWGQTPVRSYSKGMKQRLGLAQAMLHNPRLIILDEPTDGVDPVGRAEIRNVLRNLRDEGVTIFLNSHLLQEIELVCDRVAIMDHGRLICVAAVQELLLGEQSLKFELQLRVSGDVAIVQEALAAARLDPAMIGRWESRQDTDHRIPISDVDQQITNLLIDELRKRQIDIQSIGRRSRTLEEAFLNLVNENHRNS